MCWCNLLAHVVSYNWPNKIIHLMSNIPMLKCSYQKINIRQPISRYEQGVLITICEILVLENISKKTHIWPFFTIQKPPDTLWHVTYHQWDSPGQSICPGPSQMPLSKWTHNWDIWHIGPPQRFCPRTKPIVPGSPYRKKPIRLNANEKLLSLIASDNG